jgi:hypothetical protein
MHSPPWGQYLCPQMALLRKLYPRLVLLPQGSHAYCTQSSLSHCLASQHLKGSLNVIADLLSYCGSSRATPHPLAADSPDGRTLTRRFHSSLPQLIPQNFEISPVPADIFSFAVLVLQTTEWSFI